MEDIGRIVGLVLRELELNSNEKICKFLDTVSFGGNPIFLSKVLDAGYELPVSNQLALLFSYASRLVSNFDNENDNDNDIQYENVNDDIIDEDVQDKKEDEEITKNTGETKQLYIDETKKSDEDENKENIGEDEYFNDEDDIISDDEDDNISDDEDFSEDEDVYQDDENSYEDQGEIKNEIIDDEKLEVIKLE